MAPPLVIDNVDLCRMVTCGSVDDGKSTLIGRLLYDSKQVMADQMEHIEEVSERRGDGPRRRVVTHRPWRQPTIEHEGS